MKHPKYLLAFLFACYTLSLMAQTVTINVDTVYGCDPTTVKFSYTTSLSVTSVAWDLGNGTTAVKDSVIIQYSKAGNYTIKLKINDTDSTTVPITIADCTDSINAANVFTPNGDGINDEYKVVYNGIKVVYLKVFTRSGVMIYETTGKDISWDGKLETGDLVQPGIYYYIIEVPDASPPKTKRGFFYVFY